MKKKIMVFMLLLSFLVGMGVPVQAKADTYYSIEEWCADNGYSLASNYSFKEDLVYVVFSSGGDYLECWGFEPDAKHYWDGSSSFRYNCGSANRDYDVLKTDSNGNVFKYVRSGYNAEGGISCESILLTETVIYDSSTFENVLLYPTVKPYTFEDWCADAGLNCSASSNESSSVIPFWYEPDSYNYIVRKTLTASSTSGVYQLTMLQRNSSSGYYPYYFEVNNLGYLGVAGAFSDTSAFTVRNFYYDADGNGWKLQDKFDVSDLPYDHTNVTFDENVVFIYSDTDIYADREASSIWQAASTEYYNVDIPEPEITRVPVGGGTTVGGNAEPGGLLDFVITLITMAWTKLFAVEVPVDGYMISFQQIVIYGALAGLLGWLFYRLFKKG